MWGLRVALWLSLSVAAITIVAVVLLSGGDDGGAPSSRFAAIHKFNTADYHSLAFDTSQAGAVLFGHHGGLQMSQDGGESWETVIAEDGRDAMNLVYDPFTPRTIYMAGHDVYYRSDDAGSTWERVESNLPGLDLHAFAASAAKEGRLYAYSVGNGLYSSEDGGALWKLVTPEAPQGTNSIVELPNGTALLGFYSLGMAVPFLAMGMAFHAVHRFYQRLGPYLGMISFASGVLLIAVGVLVYTGSLVTINRFFGFGPGGLSGTL